MGIYDRDYYRKEGPSYLERLIPRGMVCKWLIGINILVYVLQLVSRGDGSITDSLWLSTDAVSHGQFWRLLTYSFLHAPDSFYHILFNMWALWLFGSEIEELYGPKEFLAIYLISAVMGGLAFQAQGMVRGVPMFALGASGAVTAVMVLFACHFPQRIIYLFFVLPVPSWLLVVIFVGLDAFQLLGRTHTDVAVAVHLGGAAFAFLYYKYQWRITSLWQGMQSWRRERSRPNLRVYHPDDDLAVPVASGVASADLDEHLDAKLDAVLEKLSRHGRESLTEKERDILLKASEIYKKKRT